MDNTEIRFSGSGGQGLILSAKILASALVDEGKNVAQSQAYEPVSRGGLSRSDLVVSTGEAAFPLGSGLDYLLVLDKAAATASDGIMNKGALVLFDAELVPNPPKGDFTVKGLPFLDTARKLGNKRVANIVALGALVKMSSICTEATLEKIVKSKSPAKFLRLNMEAMKAGLALGEPAPVS